VKQQQTNDELIKATAVYYHHHPTRVQADDLTMLPHLTLLFLVITSCLVPSTTADEVRVSFVNYASEPITLYWEGPDGDRVDVGALQPYEIARHATFAGHKFSYDLPHGDRVNYLVQGNDVHPMQLPSSPINVLCSTTQGDLHITVQPQWSPLGAARFLELVSIEYFDGCALNRVVKGFLTQFGISADYQLRTDYRQKTIPDDIPPRGISFQPGYMAYAGSGPDSRTTEMFIVMPDTPPHQLRAFGQNPWETPFAYVDAKDVQDVVAQWYAYGDMPPWGKGPDPQLIYQKDGYEYLKQNFPQMDYMDTCRIVDGQTLEEEL
jgi:peptidyl-prolyl cis-trans isomerase A (cyclophilin A)